MKRFNQLLLAIIVMISFFACTKTESDFSTVAPETISLIPSATNFSVGTTVKFNVSSSVNNTDVTATSRIFINGTPISADTFRFSTIGTFAVYATKGTLTSNIVSIQVTAIPTSVTGFAHNVLIEDYSGNWCGNCPRLLYGLQLLHQQTSRAYSVGIHLFGGDPFISTAGNNLASNQGVNSVPTGNINRTTSWVGPQYQHVNQVLNLIQTKVSSGLAISSTNNNGGVTATIKFSHIQPSTANTKLTVYLVEDSLFATQRNYSSDIYGGQSSIANFKYDGVLRTIISDISGDAVANTGTNISKVYNFSLPSNVSNSNRVRIIAFLTDNTGKVINVQSAKVGTNKDFENL